MEGVTRQIQPQEYEAILHRLREKRLIPVELEES